MAAYRRSVGSDEAKKRFAEDARLLEEIGAALASQNTRIQLRLPAHLAARARDAWDRDEYDDPGPESAEDRSNRSRAGDLALIGLAVEKSGVRSGGEIDVELDATLVAAALTAHYERESG